MEGLILGIRKQNNLKVEMAGRPEACGAQFKKGCALGFRILS